jgi:hypothetical protein
MAKMATFTVELPEWMLRALDAEVARIQAIEDRSEDDDRGGYRNNPLTRSDVIESWCEDQLAGSFSTMVKIAMRLDREHPDILEEIIERLPEESKQQVRDLYEERCIAERSPEFVTVTSSGEIRREN